VEIILRFYRDIDKTIRLNERIIKNLEDQYYIGVSAVNMDGVPRAPGGASSPVERIVLNIPRSVTNTIDSMNRENEKLAKIKAEILSEINRLNFHQKAVLLGFYVEGGTWERISEQINYSPRQCRNIRDAALDRLGQGFLQNQAVSRYQFPKK